MNLQTISSTIRKRRKCLGIRQKELADYAGISLHTLSNIESGKGNPSFSVLYKILDILGMEISIKVRGIDK